MATRSYADEEVEDEEVGETWDDWVEDEDENTESSEESCQCVFCEAVFRKDALLLTHVQEMHHFDLQREIQTRRLDMYGTIRLVNFLRRKHVEGLQAEEVLALLEKDGVAAFASDEFLQPVLPNDPLLYCLECVESDDEEEEVDDGESKQEEVPPQHQDLVSMVRQLQAENAALRQQVAKSTQLMRDLVVEDNTGFSESAINTPDNDTYYFDSYSHVGIHREMLSDRVRTESYRDAILNNRHLFEGKVVLDVGCGTGVLSLFAAKAGASRVIGVDCSAMGDVAQDIVAQNGFGNVITIIKGKVEELELPVTKVDVIISEWMGYCLLYEAMLDTVLFARDKWLKPEGHLLPDKCALFLQGTDDSNKRLAFWDDVYGFNMQPMRAKITLKDAFVEKVPASDVLTDRTLLQNFDIDTVKPEELDFRADFVLETKKAGKFHGFVSSFDMGFERDCTSPVHFTTGVEGAPTHWHQVFFHINEPFDVESGERIQGQWGMRRNPENPRFLDVDLKWKRPCDAAFTSQRFRIHD